ncbi:hypothetical protein Tco_0313165 [Tanacetum coccineum]
MMLLAQAITQKFSTSTNNRLHTSSNTRNQAVIRDGRVDMQQTKNAGYDGNVIMMARIQPADDNADFEPSYNAKVVSENQDLLMTISELKNKLKIINKGKNVNTKFDKSETSGTLLCVTPLPKNIAVKAKKVSNTKVNADSSNSVRRSKSKDTKSKDRVLKNTNDKRSSAHVRKMSRSVSIDSNKRETMHLNVCQSNTSVLDTKILNAVNDGSNIVCVSCGKDVFLISHAKCVARYALSRDSMVNRVSKGPFDGNLSLLRNFFKKFMGTVRFKNDHFAAITGYGDYI